MSLEELYTILNSISGFNGKVAYRCFPTKQTLPFICYLETGTDNVFADNKVHHVKRAIDIELYTENKDTASETLVETALNNACLPWNKTEDYIDEEQCYQIIYEVEI